MNMKLSKILSFAGYYVLMAVIVVFAVGRVAFADGEPTGESVLGQLFSTIGNLKGLKWQLALAGFVTVAVSALKVSAWRPLWDKLGWFKAFLAPILSLAVVYLTAWASGNLGGSTAWLALTTGVGSVALHELLDAVKGIPGVGKVPLMLTDLVAMLLGGTKTLPPVKN